VGRVCTAVLGGGAFDSDAVAGQERPGAGPEGQRGCGGLLVEGPGVGRPAVGVDGRVHVVVAEVGSPVHLAGDGPDCGGPAGRGCLGAGVDAPAATIGDVAQLL